MLTQEDKSRNYIGYKLNDFWNVAKQDLATGSFSKVVKASHTGVGEITGMSNCSLFEAIYVVGKT